MERRRTGAGTCWLIAMGMCALLWGAVALWGDLSYAVNDDADILRAFMGYQTGEAPTFHIFLHGLLTWPLHWLSAAFPGTAWFSWLQIALLWLAGVVAVKSMLMRCLAQGKPLWLGIALGALYLAVFCAAYWVHPTFTITAAQLGAAAVAQILSVDFEYASDGKILRSLAFALVLATLCYALRQVAVLPVLGFCGLCLVVMGARYFPKGKRSWKPLALAAVMAAAVMGGLYAQREWEIDQTGSREYLAWQEASGRVLDYTGMDNVSSETLEKLGWSRAEYRLVNDWYFLDQNISTQAFDVIYAEERKALGDGLGARLRLARRTLSDLCLYEGTGLISFGVTVALLLACWLGLGFRREKRPAVGLGLLGGLVLCLGLLFYLALKGRMPLRAVLLPALPVTAMAFLLLPDCLPETFGREAKLAFACCGLACALAAAAYGIPTFSACLRPPYDPETAGEGEISADLDQYALENPEYLVIYDQTLFRDRRLFPDVSQGIPRNVMFWGCWPLRSPENLRQMAAFGIDGMAFTPKDFLRENVCLASGVMDPPAERVLEYLRGALGPEIDYHYEGYVGNVHVFTFYDPNA